MAITISDNLMSNSEKEKGEPQWTRLKVFCQLNQNRCIPDGSGISGISGSS
jgi:hypothetical protein